jgi:A/G-specific adenine glycosylase
MVSEVMLQQTQVSRVIPKYQEFIARFPAVSDLAKATDGDVLRIWKGLGYNRRAVYLKRAAKQIVSDYKGVFPKTDTKLVRLSGLGTYTARAICIFAYKHDIATIDTNIRRIITHFFFHDIEQKPKIIEHTAALLVPKKKSWEWHQALMDYGAIELQKIPSIGKKKKRNIPFRKTDRFVRGRIIDMVRTGPIDENELIHDIAETCDKDIFVVVVIVETLIQEGLLEHRNGMYQLPE